MIWGESRVIEARLRFVVAASRQEESVIALCREFQISRQTRHSWLKRYRGRALATRYAAVSGLCPGMGLSARGGSEVVSRSRSAFLKLISN